MLVPIAQLGVWIAKVLSQVAVTSLVLALTNQADFSRTAYGFNKVHLNQ